MASAHLHSRPELVSGIPASLNHPKSQNCIRIRLTLTRLLAHILWYQIFRARKYIPGTALLSCSHFGLTDRGMRQRTWMESFVVTDYHTEGALVAHQISGLFNWAHRMLAFKNYFLIFKSHKMSQNLHCQLLSRSPHFLISSLQWSGAE